MIHKSTINQADFVTVHFVVTMLGRNPNGFVHFLGDERVKTSASDFLKSICAASHAMLRMGESYSAQIFSKQERITLACLQALARNQAWLALDTVASRPPVRGIEKQGWLSALDVSYQEICECLQTMGFADFAEALRDMSLPASDLKNPQAGHHP